MTLSKSWCATATELRLTRKTAIAPPTACPAMTSLQWFLYSTTLLMPVSTARLTNVRLRTGPVRWPPAEPTQHKTYIWKGRGFVCVWHYFRPVLLLKVSADTHCQVNSCVQTQCCLFGGESLPGSQDVIRVPSTSIWLADKIACVVATKGGVIGLAHRQEVRSQTSCDKLTSVDKDVRHKQTEYIHTYRETCTP